MIVEKIWHRIHFIDCYNYNDYDENSINLFVSSDIIDLKSYFTYIVDSGYKRDLILGDNLMLDSSFST